MTIKRELDPIAQLRHLCRQHGLRVTPQKIMIYQELQKASDHPSPEQLFQRLQRTHPELSLDTVYRTLASFAEIGLVDLVEGYGTARRFDPRREKHHHFHCRKCGAILDFTSDQYDQLAIPASISRDCQVLNLRVTIEGYCKQCRSKTNI